MIQEPARRALVTGDLGFLGRHFRTELESRGYMVTGCDVKRVAELGVSPLGEDCRTAVFARDDLPPFDLVVHCAAVIGGRAQIDGFPLATSINLGLDAAYFRWLARVRPAHAVYISSSAVYPVDLQIGSVKTSLREEQQRPSSNRVGTPDQVYGWTKLVGEVLAQRAIESGVLTTIVRPFSGYGADQDLTYPFPSFISRARERQDPFLIWGNGRQVRDFVHVNDVIRATLAAVDHDAAYWDETVSDVVPTASELVYLRRGLRPFNICTGRATSFDELADVVCEAAGYSPEYRHLDHLPSGVAYRVGDPERLKTIYDLTTTLEEGVWHAT